MSDRPLIPLLLTFMAGILVGHAGQGPPEALLLFLVCSSALLLALYPFLADRRLKTVSILFIFFLCGILLQVHSRKPSRILPFAERREKVTVEGVLLAPPQTLDNRSRLTILARTLLLHEKRIPLNEKLLVTVYRNTPEGLHPAQNLRLPVKLHAFRNFKNPGSYDYETAMKLKGFSCGGSVSDGRSILVTGNGSLPFPLQYLAFLRQPLREFFHRRLPFEDAALFSALILGERQNISPDLRETFNRTGLGHVLAVSGLHIGLVSWVAFFFFKWLLTRSYRLTLAINVRKAAALLTCIPVVLYAALAGLQVSCQRAMIMALVFFGSILLDREKDVWSTLALAAFIILAMKPMALFSAGFQLSFTAVAGILWLGIPFLTAKKAPMEDTPLTGRLRSRLERGLVGLVIISLSAQVMLLPLILRFFHQVSPVALPANITTIPLLGFWVIPSGLLAALAYPLSSSLAGMILHLGAMGMHVMMGIITFWSNVPFASFWIVTPSWLETVLFYTLLLCIFSLKKWRWTRPALAVVCLAFVLDAAYWVHATSFNQGIRVTYLDVGQGNAAFVQFPGSKRMIIDGGGFAGSGFDVGRNVIAPFLWKEKIARVDYLLLSHPQADHMKGLIFLAQAFHPKEFWYTGDSSRDAAFSQLMKVIRDRKIAVSSADSVLRNRTIAGVTVQILHPPPHSGLSRFHKKRMTLNDRSLVLRCSYGGVSFLFPGDIEKKGEKVLLKNAAHRIKSQILLVPHHGSKTSNTDAFLTAVSPQLSVISCGAQNRFGFPHPSTLQKLRQQESRIFRTDRDGAIQITLFGKERDGSIRTYRNHWKSLPFRLTP